MATFTATDTKAAEQLTARCEQAHAELSALGELRGTLTPASTWSK